MSAHTSGFLPDLTNRFIDNDNFRIAKPLRAGGYGFVYHALDTVAPPHIRKEYAVKCMLKATPDHPMARHQDREMALHAMVSHHPGVITLHRVVEHGGLLFLVMDLCKSGDMFDAVMVRQIYKNNDELLKLAFTRLIDAVEGCHKQGVFHRDLKLDNILVSEEGSQLWLTDFGLATSDVMSTEYGNGTPTYMSPECARQIAGGSFSSAASDVWSLGVILFNMITLSNPWNHTRSDDNMFKDYLRNPDFTPKYSMSDAANTLFKRIFTLDPFCRISLAGLREEVANIHSFFPAKKARPALATLSSFCAYGDRSHKTSSIVGSTPSVSDLYAILDSVAPIPPSSTPGNSCPSSTGSQSDISSSDHDSDVPQTPVALPPRLKSTNPKLSKKTFFKGLSREAFRKFFGVDIS